MVPPRGVAYDLEAMRVLICDDEPSVRLLFRTAVEDLGWEVIEAANGAECVALAVAESPDVVILDIFMPVTDGLTALPSLRARCPGTRVFIVSAHASREAFAEGEASGATACFDKLSFLEHIPALLQTA
jgi:CheY-like chemotaxis protein